MENIIGRWGAIPLTELKKRNLDDYVHIDDVDKINSITQPVNLIIGIDNDYLLLKLDNQYNIRIDSKIVQERSAPDYFIGDKVQVLNSKGSVEIGTVNDFYWHSNAQKYIYLLEVNGKIKSRRYFAEDFLPI
jgi:hypothetical protein